MAFGTDFFYFLWHGWLLAPILAETPLGRLLSRILPIKKLQCAYGAKTDDILMAWNVDQRFVDTLESSVLADNRDVWTDGCLVADDLTGSAAGVLGFTHMRQDLGGSICAGGTLICCFEMVT